eukprot:543347_1
MNRGFFQQHQQIQPQPFTNTNSNHNNISDNMEIDEMKNTKNIDEMKNTQQIQTIQPNEFKFDLPYQKKDFHSSVTIRGTLNDDQKYNVWRKIHDVDKKEKKMSPSWLSRERESIAQGILINAFHVKPQDIPKTKTETLKLCFEKLKMLTAHKKLEVKALMLFDEDEIKVIETKMLSKMKAMDLTRELFDYFASDESCLINEFFMDILDDCIVHKLYESAVFDIYNGLHQIMMRAKSAQKFDSQFIAYQKNRLKCAELKKLLKIFDELCNNLSRTYEVNQRLLSNIYIYSMLDVYLNHMTCIVYELLENSLEQGCIDNNITTEQAASFGGSGYCSLQRIAYSRNLTVELRKRRICLQKYMLCQENERELVAKELHYENMGGMYFITPSLYPLCKRVLLPLAVALNRSLLLPSVMLPEFTTIINNCINNKQNIEKFKKFYQSNI